MSTRREVVAWPTNTAQSSPQPLSPTGAVSSPGMPQPTGPRPATRKLTRKTTEPPQDVPASAPLPPTIPLDVPIHRYRVLFADGALVDFLAYADHSGIRGQMLEAHYGKRPQKDTEARIEGIAHLGIVYTHTPQAPSP